MFKKFIFIAIMFLLLPVYAKAATLTCRYIYEPGTSGNLIFDVEYNSNSNGTPKYTIIEDTLYTKKVNISKFELNSQDFLKDDNSTFCPNIYIEKGSHRTDLSIYNVKSENANITEVAGYSAPKDKLEFLCRYKYVDGKVTAILNMIYSPKKGQSSATVVESSDASYKNDAPVLLSPQDYADNMNNCPTVTISRNTLLEKRFYIYGVYYRSDTNVGVVNEKSVEGKLIYGMDRYNGSGTTGHGVNNDPVDCDALLPEEVQSILKDILSIAKYAGPILVIVLTIVDLIKASASGDDSEMKKVSGKFIKRLIAAIMLFFIPVLIGIIFDFFDITATDCGTLANIIFRL